MRFQEDGWRNWVVLLSKYVRRLCLKWNWYDPGMIKESYSIEECFEFLSEIGVLDKFWEILVDGFGGNFLMSVVKNELFELGLKLIVSGWVLEEVSEVGALKGLLVMGLERGPSLGGFHGM